jgi:hypothetical protein
LPAPPCACIVTAHRTARSWLDLLSNYYLLIKVGIVLVVAIFGGALLGDLIGDRLGTQPFFLITGLFAGTAVGGAAAATMVARFIRGMQQ